MLKKLRQWTDGSSIGSFLTWDAKQELLERKARAKTVLEDLERRVTRLRGEGVLLELK